MGLKFGIGAPEDAETPDAIADPAEPEIEPDPPAERLGNANNGRRRGRAPRGAPPRVTAKQRAQVQDNVAMLLDTLMWPVSVRDPICSGAYNEQAEIIHKRMSTIICKRARLLEWFSSDGDFLDWVGLAMALRPVVETVWRHHMTHEFDTDEGGDPVDLSQYRAPQFVG